MENKISFISGFVLTSLWTMPLYEMGMALLLGIIGGFGGLIGRTIFKKVEKWLNKE
jgi:hypothetical protein